MSQVYAYHLDRSRPLWMMWVVEGLDSGKVAVVTLVHHAYVDGVGAAWNLQQLYRPEPGWKPDHVPPWRARPWPSWGKRLWWGARELPKVLMKNLPRVVSGLREQRALEKRYEAEGKPAHPKATMMRQTPINRNLSYGRTFVCDSMPLEDLKSVSKAFGVTINDVFMTCVSGTLRQVLRDANYDADQHPLIGATPFAGERREGWQGLGNFATLDYCWLHSEIEDPIERLRASHEASQQMKEHLKASVEAGADINAIFQVCPPWLIALIRWYINRQQGAISFFANAILSNVPGPREPIYINRYKLDSWFSTGQIVDGTCINMTMWSYCGRANLCILADEEIIPDGWVVFQYFLTELAVLVELTPDAIQGEEKPAA
jgi:WS/DGAT/MGAT family acyltransferase